MKPQLAAALTALLITSSPSTQAASSLDLSVRGLITPSACTPGLSDNGAVDFGKIPARDLNADNNTYLPQKVLQLGVECDASTLFALRLTDNRAGSSPSPGHALGLGLINGDEKLGGYNVLLASPFADGASISQLQSLDDGRSWNLIPDGTGLPAQRLAAFGNAASGAWAPVPITQLNVDLHLHTFISPAQNLGLEHEVPLDGSATLDVIYL